MGRTPRIIVKDRAYEIGFRAQEGFPLPQTETSNAILKGIFGRANRDDKVELHNFTVMTNHFHGLLTPKEPEKFPQFYCEVLKKITDALRKMLKRKRLNIWEDRPTVMIVDSVDDCIDRLVYIFTNPTESHLEDCIEKYPGISTWNAFISAAPSVDTVCTEDVYWYPVDTLPELPSNGVLTPSQDRACLEQLMSEKDRVPHTLAFKPFGFLKNYGITEPSKIEEIRQQVITRVREAELELKAQRAKENKRVIGAANLRSTPCMAPHQPKKRSRKIFLLCRDKERRITILEHLKSIFERCRECYEELKKGLNPEWPEGTFVPWFPPRCGYELPDH